MKTSIRWDSRAILSRMGGDVGGTLHIEAPGGTYLTMRVPDRNWQEKTSHDLFSWFGELFTSPFSGLGRLVLNTGDFLTNPKTEITSPLALWIARGKVDGFNGTQSEELRTRLAKTRNYNAFRVAEFAFGINPDWLKWLPDSISESQLAGAIHIGIGTNNGCLRADCPEMQKFQYGRYDAKIHIDAIKFGATIRFRDKDGTTRVIVENGKLLAN